MKLHRLLGIVAATALSVLAALKLAGAEGLLLETGASMSPDRRGVGLD